MHPRRHAGAQRDGCGNHSLKNRDLGLVALSSASTLRTAGAASWTLGRKLECTMAATTHIPIEVYLRSSYEPDAEYVDGVIEERAA
jgi:hypothetical protein